MSATEILKRNGYEVKESEPLIKEENKEEKKEDEDADLLARLNSKGFNLTSLDDLRGRTTTTPTTQEEDTPEKKREKARQYALENNLVDKDTLTAYEQDLAKGDALDFELFQKEFLAQIAGTDEEGTYTDEDIREVYDATNFADKDEKSPQKKIRQKEIKAKVENYLKGKYGKVLEIDSHYESFQTEMKQAQQYKGIVEQAVSKLEKKVSFNIDGVTVEYEPTTETVERVKNTYLDPKAYQTLGKGATTESLSTAMRTLILSQELDKVLAEVATSYHTKKMETAQMGRRGIIERDTTGEPVIQGNSSNPRATELLNQAKVSS